MPEMLLSTLLTRQRALKNLELKTYKLLPQLRRYGDYSGMIDLLSGLDKVEHLKIVVPCGQDICAVACSLLEKWKAVKTLDLDFQESKKFGEASYASDNACVSVDKPFRVPRLKYLTIYHTQVQGADSILNALDEYLLGFRSSLVELRVCLRGYKATPRIQGILNHAGTLRRLLVDVRSKPFNKQYEYHPDDSVIVYSLSIGGRFAVVLYTWYS